MEQLADIYGDLGLSPPLGTIIAASALPRACRRLLVHRSGMTRTLEIAYGQTLTLEVLRSVLHGALLTRQVLLVLPTSRVVVEMALIRIHLENLPDTVRARVLEEEIPLGTILRLHDVPCEYQPYLYFAVTAEPSLREHARISAAKPLYGRRVRLSVSTGAPIADAIEISIPPCDVGEEYRSRTQRSDNMENTLTGAAEVVRRIKQMLVEDLQLKLVPDEIPDDYSLLEGGLALDSILIAELIAQIEDRFGLEFDDRVMDAGLFDNLSVLAAFVAGEYRAATSGGESHAGGSPC